ncbi:translocation/assembly module TamB domain-containing protein [Caviibacterium pharyngocola]|uniref:DUF490 domain-containing protein n=1 Tax=Caviibacterium pharyngocola TaxID=28159 RepID=A0A2M8RWI2_9PAST|nr:translocation/assembly module TamB domain-containing protein [Caviibacterium pharyngocola]PJG83245.1 DUF490 domain-containing protein [Caviibacterium pharyngocola]
MTEQQGVQNHSPATNETETSAKASKKKTCRRVLCGLSAVVFLPVFGLLGALATDAGQRELIRLTDKFMDNLSIEQVEGGLQNGLLLKNLRFQSPGVDTQIEQARLQLDLGCLWRAKICLQDLSVQRPQIQIDTAQLPPSEEKPKDNTPLQKIHLPVAVEVNNVSLSDLNLTLDNHHIGLNAFQTALSLNNDTGLTLEPTLIDGVSVQTTVVAEKEKAAKPAEPSAPIDWAKLEQDLTPPLLGALTTIELPFDLHVKDIQGKDWQYRKIDGETEQKIEIPSLQLQADATGYDVRLQTLRVESSLGNINGQGQLQLNDDFPLDFKLNADLKAQTDGKQILLPASQADLSLSGALRKQTALSLKTGGAADLTVTGEIALNEEKTPLSLNILSPNFQYPFDKNAQDPLSVKGLNLSLQGNLLDYQLRLNSEIGGMGAPKTRIETAAKGGLSNLSIEKLQLDALKGTLALQGEADWKDGVKWQSAVDFSNVNFAEYLPTMPAVLSGKIQSDGSVQGQNWAVNVPQLDVNGTLSGRPLHLKGTLGSTPEKLFSTPNLLLNYAENKIAVQGEVGKQSDLNLDINAPDLKGLLPDLSASLKGTAHLKGNITAPNVDVDLLGRQIRFQALQLNHLALKGKITSEKLIQGNAEIDLDGLSYNDIKINQAKLSASGDEKNHRLQLVSTGDPVAANLNLSGNFDRTSQIWKGALSDIGIRSPVGDWKTDQNINVIYDNQKISANVSSHCWRNTDIDLCFPKAFNAGKNGEIPFELKKLDLALVNKLIEQELLTGQLHSKGNVAWFTDKPVQLALQIDGDNLALAHKIDYRTFKLAVPKLNVNADLQNNNLTLKSDIEIQNQGKIGTDLKLQDVANARSLSGGLTIRNLNLNLANQLLSDGEKVNGDVTADLKFGGNLTAPLLHGAFNAANLTAVMKSLPFDINGGNIALNFHGNRSTLQGHIQTPDSRLDVDGEASWKDLNSWNTQVRAKADQFKVNIPSMAKLKISPNIEMKANPKLLELSGMIEIPWARVEIESLPDSAVAVSEDEVILDGPNKTKEKRLNTQMAAKTKSGMEIRSDLKIKIGDDVNLNAYGLKTDLDGLLSVKQDKGKLGLYGQINLQNGRYASFGQDLLIRQGIISFSGLPSQPMLNITAIRNPTAMEDSNIVAGVKVVGLADSPEVTVFAEPAMPQDQALSYLLTGRSLENSGEAGSGGSIGAALLGMGLAKSGKVVGGIGEAFGIQDLNLGTQGVGDSSKVVVSGNITPRLQVKYGVGLFDGLAEFTLRYKLLPQLYLQSVSGVNQAFDLLYHFEF